MRIELKACVIALAAMVWLAPAAAQAKWLRAESPHFVVYSAGGETDLRSYVQTLEEFDRLLRRMHSDIIAVDGVPKLEIYMVSGSSGLRQVFPQMREGTGGVYTAGENGVFAVAFKPNDIYDDTIVKHEYYHHFMLQNFPGGYPAWMVEGMAEFFSTAKAFDGKMLAGGPREGFMQLLLTNSYWVPFGDLLTKTVFETRQASVLNYYAEAWALTNYMMTDNQRRKQIIAYVQAVRSGQDLVEAWTAAVGETPDVTQKKVRNYLGGDKLQALGVDVDAKQKASITVTPMPASADDLLLEGQQLKHGVSKERRADLLVEVRADAAKYPGDRLADIVLARAEIATADLAAAESILTRRLQADPNDVEARLLQAQARMAAGDASPERRAALYREADLILVPAVKAAPDDFRLLYAYARSRSLGPGYPSDNMLAILIRAEELGPQVSDIRFMAADALATRGRYDEAIMLLQPVANDPHDAKGAETARGLLEKVQAAKAAKAAPPAPVHP